MGDVRNGSEKVKKEEDRGKVRGKQLVRQVFDEVKHLCKRFRFWGSGRCRAPSLEVF